MKTVYLSDAKRNLILDVFAKLPYNVLLKWENDTLPGKPENVFISKWTPQLTVLGTYLMKFKKKWQVTLISKIFLHNDIISLPPHEFLVT